MFRVNGAQPSQWGGSHPANVYGGRDPKEWRGKKLPEGIYVAGDWNAMPTLEGAVMSGVKAAGVVVEEM